MRLSSLARSLTTLLIGCVALSSLVLLSSLAAAPQLGTSTSIYLPLVARPASNGLLAYLSDPLLNPQRTSTIYTIAVSGEGPLQLTSTPALLGPLVWSPDGARVASTVYPYRCNTCPATAFVVSASGGVERAITTVITDTRSPVWSPDGGRIALVSANPAPNNRSVYIVNADGSGPIRAFDQRAISTYELTSEPVWSPDGSRVAATFFAAGKGVVCLSGAGSVPTTCLDRLEVVAGAPAWSPDGRALAVVAAASDGSRSYGLYALPVDGSAPRALADCGPNGCQEPRWSPDGNRVLFTSNVEGTQVLFVVGADGQGRRPLTLAGLSAAGPVWSPDGSQIAFFTVDLFAQRTMIYTVGADGAGLQPVTRGTYPAWQP